MIAIYKRELKAYFQSFVGFLFIAVTLFFIGLYFTAYNLLSGYPNFSYALSSVLFIFMISIPILTMRALSEEKKQKTDQLILTAPVTVGQIVIGKFLALSTIFTIPTLVACIYPVIMAQFGTIPVAETYIAVLAFFLYGEVCIAMGLFVSSLTESQVIAAVISFGMLFLGYMMSSICGLISSSGNLLTKIMGCYDFYTPFYHLVQGTLSISSIVYFLSVMALLLFLTSQSIQKRRYSVSVHSLKIGAYSSGMIVVSLVIVVIANLVVSKLPESITTIDVTSNQLYSLTNETKDYVAALDQDITMYVLASENNYDTTVANTLTKIAESSDHITLEYVDPTINPNFASKYTQTSLSSGSVIVVSELRSTTVDYSSMYETTLDYTTYQTSYTGYDAEGQLVSALDYVTCESVGKIYFTTGHGEYTLGTNFQSAIDKTNIETETITLLDYDSIPEDADCLVINAAVTDFSADDLTKVENYLDQGGNVIMIYGYSDQDMTNVDALTAYMGMSVAPGLVVETDENYYYSNQYYIFPSMISDSFTSGIYNNYYIFAPFAQGIQIIDEAAEGVTYTTVLSSSDSAFSRSGLDNTTTMTMTADDIAGPFGICVRAEKELEEGTATMVLVSCEQMFTDEASAQVSGSNLQLFTNIFTSYVEGHETAVSIPVKSYDLSSLVITAANSITIAVIVTVIIPVALLILGFVIWIRRRKR